MWDIQNEQYHASSAKKLKVIPREVGAWQKWVLERTPKQQDGGWTLLFVELNNKNLVTDFTNVQQIHIKTFNK